MAPRLTVEDSARLQEFLRDQKIAVVATIGGDGTPQLTPLWYGLSDGKLTLSTTKETVKYRNLLRDGRMTVCVYSEPAAEDYVTVWGQVEISDDESIWPLTRELVERYKEPADAESHVRRLRTQNRIIISLEPERVVFRNR